MPAVCRDAGAGSNADAVAAAAGDADAAGHVGACRFCTGNAASFRSGRDAGGRAVSGPDCDGRRHSPAARRPPLRPQPRRGRSMSWKA